MLISFIKYSQIKMAGNFPARDGPGSFDQPLFVLIYYNFFPRFSTYKRRYSATKTTTVPQLYSLCTPRSTGIRRHHAHLRETGCGCPVDTSAKQKHRPSRQARPRTFEARMGYALDGIKETSRFLIASSINRDRSSRLD